MTENEKTQELHKIGKVIKRLFPDFHGYVQYNLQPERKKAMLTKHETLIENKS